MGDTANQLVLAGIGLWGNQRNHSGSIRRADGHPALAGREREIKGESESELVDIEPKASFLVANEDRDGVQAQVAVLPVR